MNELISLSGYAGVGKDAAAEALVRDYGYSLGGFGPHVAALLAQVNPIVFFDGSPVGYAEVLTRVGYEASKQVPTVRDMLQDLGSGVKRHAPTYWLDRVLETREGPTVITGPRSPAEVDGIRNAGGVTICVDRLGYGPANGHENETDLDRCTFDAHVANDSTIKDLVEKVLLAAA